MRAGPSAQGDPARAEGRELLIELNLDADPRSGMAILLNDVTGPPAASDFLL